MTMASATTGLCVGRLTVSPERVVFVKGIVEASEGLAALFAERGGELSIASPHDRAEELAELLRDLASELGGTFQLEAPHEQGAHLASPADR